MASLKKNPEVIALIEEAVNKANEVATKAQEKALKNQRKDILTVIKDTVKADVAAQKDAGNKADAKLIKGFGDTLLSALAE